MPLKSKNSLISCKFTSFIQQLFHFPLFGFHLSLSMNFFFHILPCLFCSKIFSQRKNIFNQSNRSRHHQQAPNTWWLAFFMWFILPNTWKYFTVFYSKILHVKYFTFENILYWKYFILKERIKFYIEIPARKM